MDTESSHPPPLPSTPPHLAHQTSPGYQRLGGRGESHLCREVRVREREGGKKREERQIEERRLGRKKGGGKRIGEKALK